MATEAEKAAYKARQAKIRKDKNVTQSQRNKQKQSTISSARTTAGVLFFMLPMGKVVRVLKSAKNAIKGLRARGAKPISKPTPTQISNAKPPTQAQLAFKPQAALPKPKSGGTTPLATKPKGNVISGTAREVKQGTSVATTGGSRAVKGPGTAVQRIIRVKDKKKPDKEMKYAQRNDKKVTGSAAKPKKKSKALRNTLIAAASVGGGYLATRDGDKTTSASISKSKPKSPSLPKSKPKRTPDTKKISSRGRPKHVDLGKVKAHKATAQKESKKAAPSKVISAGPNTGFGPKGNIFPGSSEERAGYMKMYGGTGSAAAKAAAEGKQGDMKAGRAAVDAAKKKRLSKKKD